MTKEMNYMVGGEAGQGVQSVGFLLAKAFARAGYHVFADQDYESRVRGGHNFFRVRVSDTDAKAIAHRDILIALNQESIDLHQEELSKHGVIVSESDKSAVPEKVKSLSVPLISLAEEKAGDKLMANTVALGAALGLVRFEIGILDTVLKDRFDKEDVAENNVKAARAGFEFAQANYRNDFEHELIPVSNNKMMLLNGNEAIALGAIAAGCKFMAAYPMTPASSIMEYLASKAKDFDLIVVQPEDEISAVNMIVGASFTGCRAMTATSGSGFCLMVEGLGLAGITETPCVLVNAQRPGPAVGLPTRTEQGDLQFVLHAHQGDFPRAVLAPASIEDAFWLTIKAFNLADRYQIPVIILTDQYLAASYATADPFDISKVTIDRGLLFSEGNGQYRRHKVTKSGISPRAFPGEKGLLVVTDADEHDEVGHLVEDANTRIEQVEKRLRKLSELRKEISPPRLVGSNNADITLIGWGSTYGALCEAIDILHKEGKEANLLHFNELWPFPSDYMNNILNKSNYSFVVENNATGQLARLIKAETGKTVSGLILKYDGRPFTPSIIAQRVKEEVD
jgi:2-oxoglutarate ferredoxin oxidoreductase subunit alpha